MRCARSAHTAAGDDDRTCGNFQDLQRGAHARLVRLRPECRYTRELRLAERLKIGLFAVDLPLVAAELEMHRAGATGDGRAERLPQHVGKAADVVDRGVELGHRLERRHIVDLLIDLAELGFRLAAARHGDDGGMCEPRVAQAGGEIEGADHLRHADTRLA